MLRWAFALAAIGWACALPLATWTASAPHPLLIPYAAAFAVYGIGAWICHQRPDRSFQLWATQMPVCARCTGIYVGAALAAIASLLARKASPPRSQSLVRWRVALAVAAAPTLVTLAVEWAGGGTPSNAVRAAAGVPIGAAVAWLVLRAEVN
jgi:uncharacterized membrane protein